VARWIGLVAERAELASRLAAEAAESARQTTAEELIAVLAHDLRNHLSVLRGRLDLLKRQAQRAGHHEYLRAADAGLAATDQLGKLVADLLDSERLARGLFSLRPEAVNLVALVQEAVNSIDTEPVGGQVTIDVAREQRGGVDGARVSVHDQGPGVPAELVPRLFQRFTRGPTSAGIGLGLFLASQIAAAHAGTLTLDSPPGTPATFSLWLPTLAD
jgi:signal transduction histidine kinase